MQVHGDHPELALNTDLMMAVTSLSMLAAVALLAAAVARRLHDSGRSAKLGLMPVPFILIAAVGFPLLIKDFTAAAGPSMGLFMALFFNNVLYMVALVVLIILLCQASVPGPNRVGEAGGGQESVSA